MLLATARCLACCLLLRVVPHAACCCAWCRMLPCNTHVSPTGSMRTNIFRCAA
jgi:hypothetical protein